jgi:hypothetical protein
MLQVAPMHDNNGKKLCLFPRQDIRYFIIPLANKRFVWNNFFPHLFPFIVIRLLDDPFISFLAG